MTSEQPFGQFTNLAKVGAEEGSSPTISKVMQAWQFSNTAGGLDKNLFLQTSVPTPTPQKGQVLVQMTAASVNPIDYKLAELPLLGRLIYGSPATPGLDFCGTVVQSNEHEFKPGQKVFGVLGGPSKNGTLGQFIVPGTATAKLPEGVDDGDAAAVTTTGITAYQSLVQGGAKAGSKVFINGGSGGVGTWTIQIAKHMGCEVTTTCSSRNVELCKSLGADEVIDYTKGDLVTALKSKGQYFDVVIDNVGQPLSRYVEADNFLKPRCKFIQVGAGMSFSEGYNLMSRMLLPSFLGNGSRPFAFVSAPRNPVNLDILGQWLAHKKIKAVIDERVPWDKAPQSYTKLKTGRAQGKIVVVGYPEES